MELIFFISSTVCSCSFTASCVSVLHKSRVLIWCTCAALCASDCRVALTAVCRICVVSASCCHDGARCSHDEREESGVFWVSERRCPLPPRSLYGKGIRLRGAETRRSASRVNSPHPGRNPPKLSLLCTSATEHGPNHC